MNRSHGRWNLVVGSMLGALAMLATSRGHAADEAHYKVLGGPGLATCAQALELAGTGNLQEEQIKSWVAGFVSGYNRYADPTGDLLGRRDPQELIDWATSYCRAHPTTTIAQLSDAMVQALIAAKKVKP